MSFKKIMFTCSLLSLSLSPVLVNAETDADFTGGVLTVPQVISGDMVFENVRLQLNFNTNIFAVLNAEPRSRFSSRIEGIDEILMDHISRLSWVNGSNGCLINSQGASAAPSGGAEYCETLEFAGHDDWRLSTSNEISEMIINADNLGVQLNYINPSCQFMVASDGFVQTENTAEPGKIIENAANSGTRCVREN